MFMRAYMDDLHARLRADDSFISAIVQFAALFLIFAIT